jgi:sugar phosphate isomerase/epimerase
MNHNNFENLGMVIANQRNLWRLEEYGLSRGEFVVFDPESRAELDEYISRRRLRFSLHNPLFRPESYPENPLLACIVDPEEERRRMAVAMMVDNISLAAEMGAEFIVVHVQRPEQFAGAAPGGFDERKALDTALASAETLAAKSAETGLPVLIENLMDNSTFHRAEQYLAVLDAFPELGFCLDVGHLDVDARKFGFDLMEFVRAVAPRTKAMHLQNSAEPSLSTAPRPWKIPVHPSQNPRDGWCDIHTIISETLKVSPDCIINFEFRPGKEHENGYIAEGMDWVRGIISENCHCGE